ncbi:lasso peptide biosynthesis B2 protein [Sphingomonas sp.]|uniref:lasso peptide biosynthesis B2 protein n=1 Tax=Sphingomonas sp. TaxID=28214 RepID=UPI000DB517F7|nr:lasso peptide biosynthesis B2 protein [Sphingomonas sp.]PZU07836.1 MAG: lasso peptide biosynthesis B2 protein [Sphingomonas sp.]
MYFRLRDGLYHCQAGRRVIFLDLIHDRYFALPQACGSAFQKLVSRRGEGFDGAHEALSLLIGRGNLIETLVPDGSLSATVIHSVEIDHQARKLPTVHMPTLALALYWELIISIQLRSRALSAVIRRAAEIPSQSRLGSPATGSRLSRMVSAFEYTAFVFGRTNRCLARSLAMFSFCRARGVPVHFVIGVRSDPFAAHAWVQKDAVVLNDTAEQVNLYTPILVLE